MMTMAKKSAATVLTVRDPKSGRLVAVRGVGALKEEQLKLKKGIDLTKPIASQVFKQARKRRSSQG